MCVYAPVGGFMQGHVRSLRGCRHQILWRSLEMAMSYLTAGTGTQTFCKSSTHSSLLSHPSSPVSNFILCVHLEV